MKKTVALTLLLGFVSLFTCAGTFNVNIVDFDKMADRVDSVTLRWVLNNSPVTNLVTYTPASNGSIEWSQSDVDFASFTAALKPGYENAKFSYYAASLPNQPPSVVGEISNGSSVPFHVNSDNDKIKYTTFVTNLVVDPMKFNLTFGANGGTVQTHSKQITYGEKYGTLPLPMRTGYLFGGWRGEGRIWTDDDRVETLTNQTFTAEWTPITYTVTFGANGGAGAMPAQSFVYDAPQSLSPCGYSLGNHDFGCWTNVVSGLTYADGAQVVNLADEQGAVVALDAVWTAKTYVVRYHVNYGEDVTVDKPVQYGAAISLRGAEGRLGYDFLGWAKNAGAVNPDYAASQSVNVNTEAFGFSDDGIFHLFAVWSPYSYSVAFHANGGTGSMVQENRLFDDGKVLPPCSFFRDGHMFVGWALSERGAVAFGDRAADNIAVKNGTLVVLYAVWIPIEYTVSFNANDPKATNEMVSVSLVYGRLVALPACTFGKDGYDFVGWALAPDGEAKYEDRAIVSNLTVTAGADVPLYACWKAQSYILTLDAAGGVFAENGLSTSNIIVTVDEKYGVLPVPTNPAPKLVFDEWRTLAGLPVTQSESAPSPSAGVTKLVAHWVKDDPLARAIDAEQLDVNQRSEYGKGVWSEVKDAAGFGGDYAQAAVTSAGIGWGQDILSMTTEVEGSGTLTFRWKIVSQNRPFGQGAKDIWSKTAERLFFSVGDVKMFGMVGASGVSMRFTDFTGENPSRMEEKADDPDWVVETVRIEAGPGEKSVLSWTFHAIEDVDAPGHAWVDAVHWVPDVGTVILFR